MTQIHFRNINIRIWAPDNIIMSHFGRIVWNVCVDSEAEQPRVLACTSNLTFCTIKRMTLCPQCSKMTSEICRIKPHCTIEKVLFQLLKICWWKIGRFPLKAKTFPQMALKLSAVGYGLDKVLSYKTSFQATMNEILMALRSVCCHRSASRVSGSEKGPKTEIPKSTFCILDGQWRTSRKMLRWPKCKRFTTSHKWHHAHGLHQENFQGGTLFSAKNPFRFWHKKVINGNSCKLSTFKTK